jgi:hypothetical protein
MPPPEDAVSFFEESRPRWKGTEHLVLGLGSTPSIEHPHSVTAIQDVTNILNVLWITPWRRSQTNRKWTGPHVCLYGSVVLSFVIPSEAEGSAIPRTPHGNVSRHGTTNLSSRPERTRASYHAELATSTYAPFRRERRMRIANSNEFDRKSGGA